MNPLLVKFGLLAITLVCVFGVTYTVYEDNYLKVEASLTGFDMGTSVATLSVQITNKMTDDLHIISITYHVYCDDAHSIIVSQGTVGGFIIPATSKVTKQISTPVENMEQIQKMVYVTADVTYQLGDYSIDHREVSRAFDLTSFGTGG